MIDQLRHDLKALATPERAKASLWFFKTGPGQYGEGDEFIGVSVPDQRSVAKKYKTASIDVITDLLHSPIHEERSVALMILVDQFRHADEFGKKKIYDFYLKNTKYINNWDLVDQSAGYIVGQYLWDKDKDILVELAKSDSIWERRIAIIGTFYFTRQKDPTWTFKIAEILLPDKHDLIHKAVGWMLREVGKNCGPETEEQFLMKHYKDMPRTMLRYSIEHFSPGKRAFYMTRD